MKDRLQLPFLAMKNAAREVKRYGDNPNGEKDSIGVSDRRIYQLNKIYWGKFLAGKILFVEAVLDGKIQNHQW